MEEATMTHHLIGLLVTLALTILVVPLAVQAQSPAKVPRIGWLSLGSPSSGPTPLRDAFRQGLLELGWVEGQTITIDSRYAEGNPDRLPDLAAELVRLKVDVIFAGNPFTALAAKQATSELPIVMAGVGDAVALELVASLARPGGNVTGLSEQYTDLVRKWLELLKEAVPQASRMAVLTLPQFWSVQSEPWEALQQAAKTMRVTLQRVEVREPTEFESAFAGMSQEHYEALLVLPHPIFVGHRTRLVILAAQSQLPTIWGPFREFVDAGGLMAYGPSLRDQYRRAAYFVDKILKGTKPADLPVEQPTTFELVINLKTATALGLTIPPSLLFQADEVIR
jgi:putative tryptophan/tyrosine transport system substrate-binding protein